jgi:excisionase family DNA binding protein
MGFSFNSVQSDITGEFLTVRSAAEISGYNKQYLRRLLRNRVFQSRKIGRIWLIDKKSFLDYLKSANKSKDKRFGPQYFMN